jgi:Flp pilus assembly protein TadD
LPGTHGDFAAWQPGVPRTSQSVGVGLPHHFRDRRTRGDSHDWASLSYSDIHTAPGAHGPLSRPGEAISLTVRGNFWRWTLCAGASLLVCFTPTFGATQNQSSQQTNRLQSSGPLAEAQSSLAHGDPEEAIQILSSYLQTQPKDSAARLALGQAYAIAGQNERAEEEFHTVLQIAPDNYLALAALGEIYDRAGQLEKAEPMLARAARVSQGGPQIRTEWAVVLARLHKYKEAQSALSGISTPSDREERIGFHRLKASVAMGLGNASAAASEMEKALVLKPDDTGLILATAVAQLQSKNWQRAASLAELVFSRTQDTRAGVVLLEAQLGIHGDFHPTLELLRSTKLTLTEELAFRQHLGEVLISNGEFSESIDELKRAAELDPHRSDLHFNLALAQFRAGRLDDALESAEKCKALGDGAELEDLLGDIQEARGDNLSAVRSYQAAVTLVPNEEKYRLSLAVELIRHKSFEAAKVVLKQAEELQPKSWRIELALGMVEYFAGSDEEASRILVHAAELAPEPEVALKYLGDIQMDQASAPDPAAVAQLCGYSDRHPKKGNMQFYCGALLFRGDYVSGDKRHAHEILGRLHAAASLLPRDASPHCQLGRAYRWVEQRQEALRESESCARLDPNSAEAHYRLAQIYQHAGQPERSQQEMKLYEAASKRVADENARRDETMKTFLYTIQKETPHHK